MGEQSSLPQFIAVGVAAFVALIAYLNYRNAKSVADTQDQARRISQDQFRLAMFDRRYKIYEACRELCAAAMSEGKVTEASYEAFLEGTRGYLFFFDDEMRSYILQVRDYAFDLLQVGIRRADTLALERSEIDDDERRAKMDQIAEEQGRLMKWFVTEREAVVERFEPWLRFAER